MDHLLLKNLAIAIVLILLTTAIHSAGAATAMRFLRPNPLAPRPRLRDRPVPFMSSVILMMFFVIVIEVALWALAYIQLGEIDSPQQAMYFSMVTFTTLGYGDVLISERWHLLASFEAATGILMFGWSTALVVAAVSKVYKKQLEPYEHDPVSKE